MRLISKEAKKIPGRTPGVGIYGPPVVQCRVCPDHGTQVARVGEGTYQCPIDHKIYNYYEGFKKENGEVIQGGGVGLQIPQDPSFWVAPHDLLILESELKKTLEKHAGLPTGREVKDVQTLEDAAEALGGAIYSTWQKIKGVLTTKANEMQTEQGKVEA